MSSIFRSEKMYLCEIYMPLESAYPILAELGEQKVVQFRDLNETSVKHRLFLNEVRMCDDLEGKLHYLRLQTRDYNVKVKTDVGNPPAPNPRQIIDLAVSGTADFDLLRKLYTEVKQISYNLSPLERTLNLHIEYQAILQTACSLLFEKVHSILDLELGLDFNVHVIGGVLPKAKWNGFERTLWRLCHGNYVLQVSDINSSETEGRMLFVILVHGTFLKNKILKLCQGFSADMYDIPESRRHCTNLNKKNKSIIADLKKAIITSKEHYTKILMMAATNLARWLIEIKKMKSIYHTMNKFRMDESETFLIAECWVPKFSFDIFKEILYTQARRSGSDIQPMVFIVSPRQENPPTYFRLNKFTKGFQNIIDAYGIANYKELNPMPYTVITFPFLFSIMFSDAGHALILVFIGMLLIIKEKQLEDIKSELFSMVFTGRYIILLMGLFSIHSGVMFNEYFAFCLKYRTAWEIQKEALDEVKNTEYIMLDPKTSFQGSPVEIGVDAIWRIAINEIQTYNSLKMKLSIILGVFHMTFGISLSLLNMVYFKDYVSIFLEFLPQLIFFGSLFGYFISLIFIKWCTYGAQFSDARSSNCAPAIIITFVNLLLPQGNSKVPEGCDDEFYPYQELVQRILFYTAVICIPWMLLGKTLYYLIRRIPPPERNALTRKKQLLENKKDISEWEMGEPLSLQPSLSYHGTSSSIKHVFWNILINQQVDEEVEEVKMSVGDMVTHQIIHTIEFILGTVSYTASYLRLWALSLAHSNLSAVLEVMVLDNFLHISMSVPVYIGGFINTLGFFSWALLTIAILIIMEGLSAFLHALRLHWMEFQTRFYVGQGYPFTPFSLKTVINEAMKELE